MRTLLALACLLAGCASAQAPSATASSPTSSAAASTALAAPASQECAASPVRQAPAAQWPEVGTLTVTVLQGKPVSIALRNGTGQLLDTVKVAEGQDPRALLEQATCRLGGVLYQAPGGKPADGTIELKVLRAAQPSEPDDLRRLCSQPDIPQGFDPSQQVRIAVEIFNESLTSPRWRAWMHRFMTDLRGAANEPAAVELKKKRGTELAGAASAAGINDCWFATRLQ